jgi:hypothetical protein
MTKQGSSWDAHVESEFVDVQDDWQSDHDLIRQEQRDQGPALLFTVINPGGTVAATATLGGRFHHVDLAQNATEMAEAELAEEIAVLAGLASRKAQAAQHAVIVGLVHSLGHDPVATSGFLEHTVGLPSPGTVATQAAEVFAARYALEQE